MSNTTSNPAQLRLALLITCILCFIAGSVACVTNHNAPKRQGLRAVWVQARSIKNSEKADEMFTQVEAGKFDAIFVEVFVYGYANYESTLLTKAPDITPGFDPLAYVIEQARARNVQVHAWLIAGPVGEVDGPILSRHPEWTMVSLDGEKANWLNYNRPDVRQFISNIALEIIENYRVDGIHFDYTRYPYPGWKWGFDSYSTREFARESGLDPQRLRYAALPAYGTFGGNPLLGINTAQVLAQFDNGRPAILLNRYGNGEAILFNWEADERQIAAGSEIMRRGINYLRKDQGQLFILQSKTTVEEYGLDDYQRTLTWLTDIGQSPLKVNEATLTRLDADDVLVMPSVYLIDSQTAATLANLVWQGLALIFIDGPTRSIGDLNIQAITGMYGRGKSFRETGLLLAAADHDLIPRSSHSAKLEDYQTWDAKWTDYRRQRISRSLETVYHQLKQESPQTVVSITVSANQETLANEHFLDWQTWLTEQYVDLLIPRVYVPEGEALRPIVAPWQPTLDTSDRVMLGLSVYTRPGSQTGKAVTDLLVEIEQAEASGSKGIILFDLEGMSEAALTALANRSVSTPGPSKTP